MASTQESLRSIADELDAERIDGQPAWHPSYGDTLREAATLLDRRTTVRLTPATLTSRQLDIIGLAAEGYRQQDIGHALFLSVYTIKTHWGLIRNTLHAMPNPPTFLQTQTQAGIVAWCIRRGIVLPHSTRVCQIPACGCTGEAHP